MYFKKILALVFACLIMLSTVSCSNESDVPEGMKKISEDNVAYDFFVYSHWLVDDGVTDCAYYSASDRSNVSMSSYLPDESHVMVEDFYQAVLATYRRDFNNFTLLEEGRTKMHMFDAYQIEYTFTFGEVTYQVYQAMTLRDTTMYVFTYTSSPEFYESHMKEVAGMLEALRFEA